MNNYRRRRRERQIIKSILELKTELGIKAEIRWDHYIVTYEYDGVYRVEPDFPNGRELEYCTIYQIQEWFHDSGFPFKVEDEREETTSANIGKTDSNSKLSEQLNTTTSRIRDDFCI